MFKAFYGEDKGWTRGRKGGGRGGGGARDTGKERVGDGSFKRVGFFFPCFLVHDFFLVIP